MVVQRYALSRPLFCMIMGSLWCTSCGYGGQEARSPDRTLHAKLHVFHGSNQAQA